MNNDDYLLEVSDELIAEASVPGGKAKLSIDYHINGKDVRTTIERGSTFDLFARRDYITLIPEYMRREFELDGAIESARLYVSARGLFEIYLNGSRIGDDYMVPGWTTYKSWIESLTYDVTEQLQKGKNAIGAIIGEGWYAGRLGVGGDYGNVHPDFICQLEVILKNGEEFVLVTDKTWAATNQGPIRVSSIFDGEIYNANLEMPGWNETGFDDSDWMNVTTSTLDPGIDLVPKEHHTVKITQKLPTLELSEPEPGKFIFDMGQNMVGWPILKIPVREEETIRVRFAEMLQKDGTLYTDNYRTARSTCYYTAARTGHLEWHPQFTFFGFRYVELSGFPEGTKPDTSWVTGAVLHSDFEKSGSFSSSHKKLNKLQENITWGQRGNFLDIPTDCPQRDERQGWTGDAQVFCPTSMFNYDVQPFWSSWLRSVRANQREDGIIPWIVPSAHKFTKFGSAGWGDVGVTAPWDIYVRTGNLSILEENYDMMKRWVAAYKKDAKDFIVYRDGFGDWLQPYSKGNLQEKRGALVGETSLELIATAYYGRCTSIMQKVARILGYSEESKSYQKQLLDIRKAFSNAFFDHSGKLTTTFETQTGYLMALGYSLLEPELREGAIRNLLREVEEADGHLRTGFLGTPLLAFVLDQTGYSEVAYEALFKETYPSWFYSIDQGATTMWERWNSYSHSEGFGDAVMNSFNHYAYGAIGQWMYERIAGLAPDPNNPGYKHFFIQPQPGGPLTWAKAELKTSYGKAKSSWEKSNDALIIEANVPPNTTATLVVPVIENSTPELFLEGKTLPLIKDNKNRYTHKIKPGEYKFTINYTY